jgi:hypothetical protein
MSRSRILLFCALVFALLSPAAILAQNARVEFPIAVVAVEGAHEPSADGTVCQLVWERVGTPTLRVASSSGDRFRQDLMDGELVTLPDVADGRACLFDVDVSIVGGRSLDISLEGSELVEVSRDDIENLSATMVLPVEVGTEGEIVLAANDYLDMDLSPAAGSVETQAPTSASTGQAVPGVLRKVAIAPDAPQATAEATPELPDATPQTGATPMVEATAEPAAEAGPIGDGTYRIVGQLDFWSGQAVTTDLGCTGGSGNEDIGPGAQVVVRNEVGAIIGYGVLDDTDRSGEDGCSYDVAIVVPEATFYVVELGDRGSVVYGFDELESTGWRMHLETGER